MSSVVEDLTPSTTTVITINGAQQSCPDSWQRLVEKWTPFITAICRQSGVNVDATDDIVQEVMVRVSKSIGHFRREPPDLLFRKWIATLTRRAIVDQRRRSARRIPPIDFEKPFTHRFVLTLRTLLHLPSDESNPDLTDSGYRKIVQSVLESVRDKVQPAQWEAFTLTTIENLSADEVGRLLNLKPENIRKIAERVRSAILERICELLNQESDSVTL